MIYLDNSATTRQYDEVTELMYRAAKDNFGNPSSLHTLGFESSKTLKQARQQVERTLPPGRVIFTSGGTESDNMALCSAAYKMKKRGKRIITTSVEHPAIMESCKRLEEVGFKIDYLPVDASGCINIKELEAALGDDVILVSVMCVNNETGTIEPVMQAVEVIARYNKEHDARVIFHSDAVQAYGKMDVSVLKADLISASGHKFHGPKGVGFLYMKESLTLPAYITGCGQESGFRSGTENSAGIAGLGLAAEIANKDIEAKARRIAEVGEYLRNGIMSEIEGVRLNGPEEIGCSLGEAGKRSPGVLNLTFEGTRGEVLLHTLEQDEIYVSTGSACSSNHTGDSYVLGSMGLEHKDIEGALRFSLSEFNTTEEMDIVIDRVKKAVERFRKLGTFR